MSKTAGLEFRYYVPTPEEAHNERMRHENEKSLKASDVEKRFLHPALQADKLFTVMVHKEQEQLAKEVLNAYPWFNKVKAVREVRTAEIKPSVDNTESALTTIIGKSGIRSTTGWTSRDVRPS